MKRKRLLFGKLALILVLSLSMLISGCSQKGSETGTPAGESQEKSEVSLRLWLTGPLFEDYLKEIIPKFEAANPGIKVQYETIDWGSYQQKILTAMGGGMAPDVVSVFATDTVPFAEKGIFKPLDGLVDVSPFIPRYIESGQWDGKQFTLPIAMTVRPLYYRQDLLKEAGFDAPPQTWAEFREVAKAMTKPGAQGNLERVGMWVPTNHPYKTVQVWLGFLANNGGKVFDEQGVPVFDSPEGVEAAQLFQDLVKVDKVDVPGTIKTDDKDMVQGKVAMLVSNSAIRGLGDFSEKVGVSLPPYNKVPAVEASGEVIGITSASKHPEEAAKLVQFLTTNVEASVLYAKLEGGIPPTETAQKDPYVTNNRLLSEMQKMANEHGYSLPKHPQWMEISAIITAALDRIIIEGASPEATLKEAGDKARALVE